MKNRDDLVVIKETDYSQDGWGQSVKVYHLKIYDKLTGELLQHKFSSWYRDIEDYEEYLGL